MSLNRSFRLVSFALALIDNLLEQESARGEYSEDGPDLEGRLGPRGGDVGRRLVGARGFAGLAETRGVWLRRAEGATGEELRCAGEDTWAEECHRHGVDKGGMQ